MWIPDRSHYNNNINTRSFRINVRFSDAFLVSYRIIQRQILQKYTCMFLLFEWVTTCDVVQVLTSASQVSFRLSSLLLSVHLGIAMQFISKFIWVNLRLNRLTQACFWHFVFCYYSCHSEHRVHVTARKPISVLKTAESLALEGEPFIAGLRSLPIQPGEYAQMHKKPST